MTSRRLEPEDWPRRAFVLSGAALASCGPVDMNTDAMASSTGRTVSVDGVPIYFERYGAGPPVVLIHGASGNLRDWTIGATQEIAKSYTVYAFDRPGHGLSGSDPIISDLSTQAALMREALRREGIEHAIVVGHSYGGSVALSWAIDAPESVTGLLVLAAPSHVWPGGVAFTNELLATPGVGSVVAGAASRLVSASYAERAAGMVFEPQTPPENYVTHLDLDLILQPKTLRANGVQIAALKEQIRAQVTRYPGLTMPVEILHGDADLTVPIDIHSIPLSKSAPNARLTVLEGVGHMPHHANTDALLEALQRLPSP